MFLEKLTVKEFIDNAKTVWVEVARSFKREFGYNATTSEINSWKKSYPVLAEMLDNTNSIIKNCLIYLEYGMPTSSARADVVIVGLDKNQNRTVIVIELKQWDSKSYEISGKNLKIGGVYYNHPSDQALSYCDYLKDLSFAFSDMEATIKCCSFLFNTNSQSIKDLKTGQFFKLTQIAPIFSGNESSEIAEWINLIIKEKPDSSFISDLENDQPKISKNLFRMVAKAVREEEAWVLLDEQKIAYNLIKDKITNYNGQKQLILITGGPGTGKSVIAAQLVGELARNEIPVVHISNSSSFTTVMRSIISKKFDSMWGSTAIKGLFRLSHNWVRRKDKFHVAICDEAHRFRSRTTFRFLNSNTPQAEEILENVDIMVAFIDERQQLRIAEEGTVRNFQKWALNSGVHKENIHGPLELKVQFRCAGNEDFVKVLDKAIYDKETSGFSHHNFEVNIHNSIEEMERFLQTKIKQGNSARIVAGFCWKWSNPDENDNLIHDVIIGNWSKPWNRKAKGTENPDNHPYTIWARRNEKQLDEVGCIYSIQGFEFDYIGVIWGEDLVFREDKWIAQKHKSFDSDFKRKGVGNEQILQLVKNAYRVLLSRGMRGCSIFCLDQETQEFLESAFMQIHKASIVQSDLSTYIN